jgi:hypothetical protein
MHDVRCIKKGVWNEHTVLKFNSGNATTSSISDYSDTVVEVDTIDNVILRGWGGDGVTFIKMDIEGAELNALKGAEQTIRKYKPKLAICVYHKANDLITIPQYIRSCVSEYKFYFRAHQLGTIGSVFYAV